MQFIERFDHHHSLDSLEAINFTLRKAAYVCGVSPQIMAGRQYSKLQIVDGLFHPLCPVMSKWSGSSANQTNFRRKGASNELHPCQSVPGIIHAT